MKMRVDSLERYAYIRDLDAVTLQWLRKRVSVLDDAHNYY
jgi:hypothetical protein